MSLDSSFVPVPASTVASVEVEGQLVLLDERGVAHALDPVASVVWSLFDGTSTLGELSADLSAAFGASLSEVHTGVVSLVEELHDKGMLADREAPVEDLRPAQQEGDRQLLVEPPSS